MVDVVFVLLLFFMACAGVKVMERELKAGLPHASGGDVSVISIDITPEGAVLLNEEPIAGAGDHDLRGLKGWFASAHERFGDADPVVIGPANDTRHERVMEVLAACSSAGVTKLAFR